MKKYILALLAIVLAQVFAFGQDSANFRIISFVPTHLFDKTFRMDFEKSLGPQQSILFSPMVRTGKVNADALRRQNSYYHYGYEAEEFGAGFELAHKIYLANALNIYAPYIGYGLHYSFSEIRYNDVEWVSFSDNSGEFFTVGEASRIQYLHKGGLNFIVGLQRRFDRLIVDIYTGGGFRYSPGNHKTANVTFTENPFKPGYSGTVFIAGLKIGGLFQ